MAANRSLSLRFVIFLSLSLPLKPFASASLSPSPPPSPLPKATPADLLSVLGPPSASSEVNPSVAKELRSCLRFLVPFTPTKPDPVVVRCSVRDRICLGRRNGGFEKENELVWWPPEPVLELARLAVDSGGDVDAIHRALDPTMLEVPDVEGSKEDGCQLTKTPYGWRFISQELNSYFEFLFQLIVARGPEVGFNVSLSRFDLFHGHLFLATGTGRLGVLFHAREYPAYDKDVFPYNLGYCQIASDVTYDDSMNLRNILWLAPMPSNLTNGWLAPGVLVILDARPDGIIYRDLIPEWVQIVRTIYNDDLGETAVDVNYLNVGEKKPDYKLFFC